MHEDRSPFVDCCNITTEDCRDLLWYYSLRYLGVYINSARTFSCSYSHAKQSTYRAFNAVFGKVGRIASSEVVVQIFKSKCLPVMYYGLETCPVNKSQTKSFSMTVALVSKDDIEFCMQMFSCPSKYCHSGNSLCSVFRNRARSELPVSFLLLVKYPLSYRIVTR